jgi:hypothetical protein
MMVILAKSSIYCFVLLPLAVTSVSTLFQFKNTQAEYNYNGKVRREGNCHRRIYTEVITR